ncbi:MAG TPA: hypothetical protein VFF93_08485 [Luteimonas sp.]|nr:hypothetical protein [Luteimonas sp.]
MTIQTLAQSSSAAAGACPCSDCRCVECRCGSNNACQCPRGNKPA